MVSYTSKCIERIQAIAEKHIKAGRPITLSCVDEYFGPKNERSFCTTFHVEEMGG